MCMCRAARVPGLGSWLGVVGVEGAGAHTAELAWAMQVWSACPHHPSCSCLLSAAHGAEHGAPYSSPHLPCIGQQHYPTPA